MINLSTKTRTGGGSFWPRGVDNAEQFNRVNEFSRSIYPIWKGIEEKDMAAELKITTAQLFSKGQVMFECLTTHKQDKAIVSSGIRPDLSTPTTLDLRKKAAAGERYGGWSSGSL